MDTSANTENHNIFKIERALAESVGIKKGSSVYIQSEGLGISFIVIDIHDDHSGYVEIKARHVVSVEE